MGLTNPTAPLHLVGIPMGDWESLEAIDMRLTRVQSEQRRMTQAVPDDEIGPPCAQYDALGHSFGPLSAGPDGIIPRCSTCTRTYCWFRGTLRGDEGRFASRRPYRVVKRANASALQRACCLHCARLDMCPEAVFYSPDKKHRAWCAAFVWQEDEGQ